MISNNARSLRGRKRMTGESLYYPRVLMRTLAQVLTEEYSEHGVHVANVVIDGLIDSPGTRALPRAQQQPDVIMNPVKIAEAFYYLHTQDKSCWTHELQLTPFPTKPSYLSGHEYDRPHTGRTPPSHLREERTGTIMGRIWRGEAAPHHVDLSAGGPIWQPAKNLTPYLK